MIGQRSRRGAVALVVAVTALPLMIAVGVAVDLTRIYIVNSRLVSATDAAALAGARAITDADRDQQIESWFWANFGHRNGNAHAGYLGSSVTRFEISVDSSKRVVRLLTEATLPTTLMQLARVLGVPGEFLTMTTRADQSAQRQDRGMELALVLDVTGSMAGDRINALRNSATAMVNSLYGNQETVANLSVAVVPYVATVNIGRSHTDWLTAGSLNQNDYAPPDHPWAGCVMARYQNGGDENDAPPGVSAFQPYLWRSTYNSNFAGKGDNDWVLDPASAYHITEYNLDNPPTDAQVDALGNDKIRGPNLSCARAVLPLTHARSVVLNQIASLRATRLGGTMANLGLQMGWATLSPRWRGVWDTSTAPLDYATPFMDKVLVLMTDGQNSWNDVNRGMPVACAAGESGCVGGYKMAAVPDYTAYGRLAENRLNLSSNTQGNATKEINTRMSRLCANIKAVGITVYTITLGLSDSDTTTRNLYQSCASRPEYYFNSPDPATLQSAFAEIAQQIAALRLTQ